MSLEYWHKQTPDKPLFPDLVWSRPQTQAGAGKLLIIGGNAHGFAAPAQAFQEAKRAGVGLTRVLLPHHVKRLLPRGASEMEFAPSTPSGSFSQPALAELLDAAAWADGVLMAGDLGRNAETAIVLEQFSLKYSGQLTLTQDALDYFVSKPEALLSRPNTLVVPGFPQLQKLAVGARFTTAFTSGMDFLRLVDALHEFTTKHAVAVVVDHLETTFVAFKGQVSTTKPGKDNQIAPASHAAVWWLQNPSKTFEALTSSLL